MNLPTAATAASAHALAGKLMLRPGVAPPTIVSTRPELALRFGAGRTVQELPALLATLHSLCAQAHRATATRAIACARSGAPQKMRSPAGTQAARLATAREQLLRITHDWPRLLPGASPEGLSDESRDAASALLLRACPLWRMDQDPADRLEGLSGWLEHHWLGLPVSQWLAHHEADPVGWAADWARSSAGAVGRPRPLVARLLASQLLGEAGAETLLLPPPPVALLDGDDRALHARLRAIAAALAAEPGFWGAPQLADGSIPDTGPWNRCHDPLPPPRQPSAWTHLVARVVDVLRLAEPGGERWLDAGALPLGPREAIAWTEMARGTLIHWLQLDADGERIQACRVLAPTEWNFHPHGPLAQTLAALSGPATEVAARRLAVAFDPCVAFEIEAAAPPAGAALDA